jgi:alpha-galactosidase
VIQLGDQYRLISPQENMVSALQYVCKDKALAVLFVFRVLLPDKANLPLINLRGLDPQALYIVDGIEQPRSGLAWIEAGLTVELKNMQTKIIKITRIT